MAKTYLVKIGSTQLDGYIQNLTIERNKLWTSADRNLAGDLKATFIGTFPKIVIEFGYLAETELKTVVGLLDTPSFSVSWWDSKAGDYKTGNFYASDYGYPVFDKSKELYEPFTVSLISYKKI